MNCPHCGAELPEDSRFCGNCGKSLDGPPPPPPPPSTPQAGGQAPPPPPPPPAAGPPAQQGSYYAEGGPEQPGERTNGLAIASLVLGIIAVPTCCCAGAGGLPGLLAVILGFMALSQINADETQKGKGLAIAGMICGGIGVLLGIVYWILMLLGQTVPMQQNYGTFR